MLSALPFLALIVSACSNPVCADDIQKRLLEDCKLTIGPSQAAQCVVLDGAPEGQAGLDTHRRDVCEASNSDGLDAECLETASCESIANNACSNASTPSAARQTCLSTCLDEVRSCQSACAMRADYDACLACDLDCLGPYSDCFDACPE